MVIAAGLITLFTLYAMRQRALVPTRLQSMAEISYEFVANMVRDNVGTDGMKYLPVHLHALHVHPVLQHDRDDARSPSPSPATSSSPSRMAPVVFIGVTIIGFWKHGAHFLQFFVPDGRADGDAAAAGADRGALLPDPPDQPVGPTVRQHDGRPHHAEGVRRLRRQRSAFLGGWARARLHGRPDRPRGRWSRSCRPMCSPS